MGDGVSTLVPSFMTERDMGLDTWSRLFYLVHGPFTALLIKLSDISLAKFFLLWLLVVESISKLV